MRTLALVLGLLLTAACSDGKVEAVAPTPTTSLDWAGQWVYINYWAEWCHPCLEEIPELNDFDAQYDNVRVVGVNFDGVTGEDLQALIDKFDIRFPVIDDPVPTLGFQRPTGLPTTFVLDPSGTLHSALEGPQTATSLAAALPPGSLKAAAD